MSPHLHRLHLGQIIIIIRKLVRFTDDRRRRRRRRPRVGGEHSKRGRGQLDLLLAQTTHPTTSGTRPRPCSGLACTQSSCSCDSRSNSQELSSDSHSDYPCCEPSSECVHALSPRRPRTPTAPPRHARSSRTSTPSSERHTRGSSRTRTRTRLGRRGDRTSSSSRTCTVRGTQPRTRSAERRCATKRSAHSSTTGSSSGEATSTRLRHSRCTTRSTQLRSRCSSLCTSAEMPEHATAAMLWRCGVALVP